MFIYMNKVHICLWDLFSGFVTNQKLFKNFLLSAHLVLPLLVTAGYAVLLTFMRSFGWIVGCILIHNLFFFIKNHLNKKYS